MTGDRLPSFGRLPQVAALVLDKHRDALGDDRTLLGDAFLTVGQPGEGTIKLTMGFGDPEDTMPYRASNNLAQERTVHLTTLLPVSKLQAMDASECETYLEARVGSELEALLKDHCKHRREAGASPKRKK